MICPGSDLDCDNPGCRHGGCQGRPPQRARTGAAVALGVPQAELIVPGRPAAAVSSVAASRDCVGVAAMTACRPWTSSRRAPTAIS